MFIFVTGFSLRAATISPFEPDRAGESSRQNREALSRERERRDGLHCEAAEGSIHDGSCKVGFFICATSRALFRMSTLSACTACSPPSSMDVSLAQLQERGPFVWATVLSCESACARIMRLRH